jgi:hypothetical protein
MNAERDSLMRDLRQAGMVDAFFQISGIGPTLRARNGEGDPYYITQTEKSTSRALSWMASRERSRRRRCRPGAGPSDQIGL